MLVTKNVAELCVLLISELYGQLPSRIFADLLARGRSTAVQLAQHTSLNFRQVRHGIAVLIQLNLIFHNTDPDSALTHYEANSYAAYNLVRTGKILDMVRNKYGHHAHTLVHEVFVQGHARISDLVKTFEDRHNEQHKGTNGISQNGTSHNGHSHANGNGATNGTGDLEMVDEDEGADLEAQAYDNLAQLIAAGILEPVTRTSYQSPQDLRSTVEQEFLANYPTGIRGSKQTSEFERSVRDKLREIQGESTRLKKKLEFEFMSELSSKRRKLTNGAVSNAFTGEKARSALLEELDTVLRVNYDKCTVELRNLKLKRYAEDLIGSITAQVYETLLAVLSKKISRCQVDKSIEVEEDDASPSTGPRVTTQEVFEQLSSAIDVSAGIGFPSEDTIDIRHAEKIRQYPPQLKGSTLRQELEEGEEIVGSDDEDYDHSGEAAASFVYHGQNGSDVKMQTDDGLPVGARRLHQMRQHLLILAESKQGFVRHCGGRDFGEWTVDFEPLMQHLQFVELDTIIENRFGRQGLRLTRILREKGKIDDKTLPSLALMKKSDVHVKMAEMEMGGFLDVQEVPRDNNRTAARTIFFWFFDLDRTLQRILDNTCKSMVRCLERLDVERRKKKNVLMTAERKDVRGMEEEKLRGYAYNEYVQFLDLEKKLLGQVMRLDDIVAVFRDF
ncbi:RNA polymerase III subunit RPC82-domain-containing protein [Hypoxylon cercidicola]|nr:RNA polymerase III subunit RPC82-domain-containing protein [Hypoxylon cercidicola]